MHNKKQLRSNRQEDELSRTDPSNKNAFDEAYDVIVIGYGFAGAVAAIEASDSGASVLLLEKMQDPGGISICAGGGLRR